MARWCSLASLALLATSCASPGEAPPPEARGAEVVVAPAGASAPAASAPTAAAGAPAGAAAPEPLGSARAERPPGDRIYAKARFVWIQPAPQPGRGWIGYLTMGGSVRLWQGSAEKAKVFGPGCDAWYRVEPTGYVCLAEETTLDPGDPVLVHLEKYGPNVESPFPFRYGESVGAPRYHEIPSEAVQREAEWDLDRHRQWLAAGKVPGVDTAPAGAEPPPLPALGPLVREARSYVAPGSTVAWSAAWDAGGRTWLMTSDHAFVPKDRVKPYPESSYRGVHLGEGIELPIAFFRKNDRDKYRREGDAFVRTGETFPRLGWVMLTGRKETRAKEAYLETREGAWVLEKDASVAAARETIPFLDKGDRASERRTWLDVSILAGTLVAYEGERPVFATLVSPGRGGLPVPGHDPLSTASTPTGGFRVDGKFKTATMVSSTDANVVHSDVQFVQNFHGPHALHGAYWHDAWGEPKSGGCVNLSPIDAKWLFAWTEPAVPEDWHGIRSVDAFGPPTRVIIRP